MSSLRFERQGVFSVRVWCAVESGYVAMSSSAARSADRGGAAGGGVRKNQRRSFTNFSIYYLAESRFAAVGQPLRLAGEPLPLYRADARHRGRHCSVSGF